MALTATFITSAVSSPAAETPVINIAPLPFNPPQGAAQGMIIRGVLNITAGTGATAVVIRCRVGQSTTTGPLVGNPLTVTLAAGASADVPFEFEDTNFVDPGAGYTITVAETGATVAGNVNQAEAELDSVIP